MDEIESIPDQPGLVVRVHSDSTAYPEVWVASYTHLGRWYPDGDTWTQTARRHLEAGGALLDDGGAHLDDLYRRGRVVLLTAGDAEAYRAGWQAGTLHVADLAEKAFNDCPPAPASEAP